MASMIDDRAFSTLLSLGRDSRHVKVRHNRTAANQFILTLYSRGISAEDGEMRCASNVTMSTRTGRYGTVHRGKLAAPRN